MEATQRQKRGRNETRLKDMHFLRGSHLMVAVFLPYSSTINHLYYGFTQAISISKQKPKNEENEAQKHFTCWVKPNHFHLFEL